MTIQEIRKQSDQVIKLKDWTMGNLIRKIAEGQIKVFGYYTYIQKETGLKIFVEV